MVLKNFQKKNYCRSLDYMFGAEIITLSLTLIRGYEKKRSPPPFERLSVKKIYEKILKFNLD